MYNKWIGLGFVTKEAELRYLPSGTPVCNFNVATNHSFKDSSGNWKKETLFMNCAVFGKFGEIISQYLKKGTPVYVEGRLQEQKWESDGQTRSKIVAILDVVKTLNKQEKEEKKEPETPELEPF